MVFFANYLRICHEAYEEALGRAGIELKAFFAANSVIIPISRSEAEYLRPLSAGDRVRVEVAPVRLDPSTYEIRYELFREGPPEKLAGRVRTEHVCIDAKTRKRLDLPPALAEWIDR